MAKAPVKSHPLHNFALPLKWGQTTTVTAASLTAVSGTEAESDPEQTTRRPPHRIGSRSARLHRFSFSSCSKLLPKLEKRQTQTTVFEITETPLKQIAVLANNDEAGGEVEEEDDKQKQEEEEGNSRPWKLRPRKGILFAKNGGELKEAMQVNEQKDGENIQQFHPKSTRWRGLAESGGGGEAFEKKGKRKFWVALSREEIEEDIFVLTWPRPARRPRKRPKNLQKVLDSVFPGLWLVGGYGRFFQRCRSSGEEIDMDHQILGHFWNPR